MAIHHVHDHLVKQALSYKNVRRQFISRLLPDEINQLIDPRHLYIEKADFINEELQESRCDVLLSTRFANRPGYLYCLVEQ